MQLKPWHPGSVQNQAKLHEAEQAQQRQAQAMAQALVSRGVVTMYEQLGHSIVIQEADGQQQEAMDTLALLEPAEAARQRYKATLLS